MTEKQEQAGPPQPAPPDGPGAPPHANPQAERGPSEPARAPLGEWRGPAFWMACGALLAGVVAGVFVLAQRVSLERDMMAVAATLPSAVPVPPESAAAKQITAPPPQPAAGAVASTDVAQVQLRPRAAPPKRRIGESFGDRKPALTRPSGATARPHRRLSAGAIRKWAAAEEKYPEVFKRCPRPGETGALRCRRDICNGAEGKGPACKPYVEKLRRQ